MTKSWLIHIVDDDEPVRASYVFALQMAGFRPVTYVDASDFLARGRHQRGVLLSDVRMPGMDGSELAQLLRSEGSDIPIILMTGHAAADLQAKLTTGADKVLIKPFSLDMLVAEIDRLTSGWT